MKSLVIGGSSIDTLITIGEIKTLEKDMTLWADNVYKTVGGTGAGKALALCTLGSQVTFITQVGDDEEGDMIKAFFDGECINLQSVSTERTTTHTNIMHSGGHRITVFTSDSGQSAPIHKDIKDFLKDTDVIFFNINQFCRKYAPLLHDTDKLIVVDIHDYNPPNPYHEDFIKVADIIIASELQLPDTFQFMKDQISSGKRLVVVTKGKDGLIAMDDDYTVYELPGYNELKYIDSNGAGDSFTAGFIMKFLESQDVETALKFGSICGRVACTSYDLYNSKYKKEDLEELLKKAAF